MRPGHACITCHTQEDEGPVFAFAGTVYPTGHEPNECYGVQSIPTMILFRNGEPAKATVGAQPKGALEKSLGLVEA